MTPHILICEPQTSFHALPYPSSTPYLNQAFDEKFSGPLPNCMQKSTVVVEAQPYGGAPVDQGVSIHGALSIVAFLHEVSIPEGTVIRVTTNGEGKGLVVTELNGLTSSKAPSDMVATAISMSGGAAGDAQASSASGTEAAKAIEVGSVVVKGEKS